MRLFAIVLSTVAFTSTVSAQPRSEQELKQIAMEKLQGLHGGRVLSRGSQAESSVDVLMEDSMYTVMGSSTEGFVVVSNDRRLRPVLAYSDHALDTDNIPCGMRWWLRAVSESLTNQLETGQTEMPVSRRAAKTRVEPMMTSQWGQGDPFNKKCPAFNGTLAPTGCVATALAQVLYYHKYPESSEGEGYYTLDDKAMQYAVALNSTYDWSLFDDKYTITYFMSQEKKDAIAQLLYDCGVATGMNYTARSSGTQLSHAGNALGANFRCDSLAVRALERDYYTTEHWMQLVRSELEAGRPVLYGGQDNAEGGHAFVLHGIDEDDLVYVNWGWGGTGDCWTSIDLLTPSNTTSSYASGQDMVIGLRKDPVPTADEKYQSCWGVATAETLSLNVFKRLQMSAFTAFNVHHLTFYGSLGAYFEKTDGSENLFVPYIQTGKDTDAVPGSSGFNFSSKSLTLTELSAGTYYVYLASLAIQEDTPQPMRQVGGKYNVYTITIHDDRSVTIDSQEQRTDVPTGIRPAVAGTTVSVAPVYDLQGRRIAAPGTKGIYIRDGKKVVVK